MSEKRLVHKSCLHIEERCYPIEVFRHGNGCHSAETRLGNYNTIINDAFSLNEVLELHRDVLPLALYARRIRPGKPCANN